MNLKNEILKVLNDHTIDVGNFNDAVLAHDFNKVSDKIVDLLPKVNTDITSSQIEAHANYKIFLKENDEPNS